MKTNVYLHSHACYVVIQPIIYNDFKFSTHYINESLLGRMIKKCQNMINAFCYRIIKKSANFGYEKTYENRKLDKI